MKALIIFVSMCYVVTFCVPVNSLSAWEKDVLYQFKRPTKIGSGLYLSIEKKLGNGFFATTFKGIFEKNGREYVVAAKFQPSSANNGSDLAYEHWVYKILGADENPSIETHGIAFIYDYTVFDEYHILVMTYLDHDLSSLNERCAPTLAKGQARCKQTEMFPVKTQLELFESALETLEYLNERGVSHRDIKPENLMIKTYRYANKTETKLVFIDFNMASVRDYPKKNIAGTLEYMSGDVVQYAGESRSGSKAGPRDHQQNEIDDLFSLFNIMRSFCQYPLMEQNALDKKVQAERYTALADKRNNVTEFVNELGYRLKENDPRQRLYLSFIKGVFVQRSYKQKYKREQRDYIVPKDFYQTYIERLCDLIRYKCETQVKKTLLDFNCVSTTNISVRKTVD